MTANRARHWALRALAAATVLAFAAVAVYGEASGQAWAAISLLAIAAGCVLLTDSAVHAERWDRARMRDIARREAEQTLAAQEVRW